MTLLPTNQFRSSQIDKDLRIVAVGAHPDDPETGCGGTLVRYGELGAVVSIMYLTKGELGIANKLPQDVASIRETEARKACDVLGARPFFLGQIDGSTEVSKPCIDQLERLIVQQDPHIVFTHWPHDTHHDHRSTGQLVELVWKRSKRQFSLYYYEVLTGFQTQNFQPTHYVDISDTEARKREAVYHHGSQDPDALYAVHGGLQEKRGKEHGVRCAEGFIQARKNMLIDR